MSWSPSTPINYASFAETARHHIEVLAQKIGGRPAGSINERQAEDYVAGFLHQLGYEIEHQPIAFAPVPPLSLPYLLGTLALCLSGWGIRPFPLVVIWLPLIMMILPQASRFWIRHRKPTQASENVFAYKNGNKSAIPKIIFTAHIDSAPALPLRNPLYLKIYGRGMDLVQRIAWMVAALALLELLGITIANIIILPVALLASLAGVALLINQWLTFLQNYKNKGEKSVEIYTPGANDNASGVGILLALAEALAQQGYRKDIAFLFTSAEECGLHGARAFCASHENWRHNAIVVCLDMVGRGDNLYYVHKLGIFNPLYTSPAVNQMLRETSPHLKAVWYTLRSGDFEEFCRAGFQTSSLQSGTTGLVDWTYHSIYDTVDKIETQTLQMVLEMLGKFIENI